MDEPELRIVHVFRAPLGGLFRHVMDLARGQIAVGHAVGILCDSTTGGPRENAMLAEIEPSLKLGLTRVPMSRKPGRSDIAALRAIQTLRRAQNPDIFHGHGSKGGVYARVPALWDRSWPATCYTPHGGSFNYRPGSNAYRVYMAVERLMKRATGAYMMESRYIEGRVRTAIGPISRPIYMVHNGISEAEFEPVSRIQDADDLLYVGELRSVKGIDTLLDALGKLASEGQRLTLRIQGSGPEEAELKDRASRLGVADQVRFVPPGPVRSAFEAARIMVVPSRFESLPYVVLEAAAGCQPLVATNVGGIPEIFGPYADRLIEPDDVSILARAIGAAASAPHDVLAHQASELSRRVKEHFSIEDMVANIVRAYSDVLHKRRAGHHNLD